MSKKHRKYIASFDCFDKSLIVLYVTTGSISVAFFATFIGVPVWIASASFTLAFSISTGMVKKLLKTTWNKKKKQELFSDSTKLKIVWIRIVTFFERRVSIILSPFLS